MRLILKYKSVLLLWQHNSSRSTAFLPLKFNSLYNRILFHSPLSKTGTLAKAITCLFPIQAYFAPKWNKTRLMISITLTLLAVYSAWSLGEGAALHKSRWWRTFTRGMIQWGDWHFVLAHQWENRASLCAAAFPLLCLETMLQIHAADAADLLWSFMGLTMDTCAMVHWSHNLSGGSGCL